MREKLTRLARALRRNETSSEEKLWLALRNRQLDGWKFKRQAPRGPYIVDFLCFDAALVIEIDGVQHDESENRAKDEVRSGYLRACGFRVLRFSNSDVLEKIDSVLDEIYLALGQTSAPTARRPRQPRTSEVTAPPIGLVSPRSIPGAKDTLT